MSKLHFSHRIPWDYLMRAGQPLDPTEISLEVGEKCELIHATDRGSQIKIENRKYIHDDQICHDQECLATGKTRQGIFGKNRKGAPSNDERAQALDRFCDGLIGAFGELVESEVRKVKEQVHTWKQAHRRPQGIEPIRQEYLEELWQSVDGFYAWDHGDPTALLFALYCRQDLATMAYLAERNYFGAENMFTNNLLGRYYGGQAVGHGYTFLHYHLLDLYLSSNWIVSQKLQGNPDKWPWAGKGYSILSTMQRDCDFYTCVPGLRPLIQPDVYMKDLGQTDELIKQLFRYMVLYEAMRRLFGSDRPSCFRKSDISSSLSNFLPVESIYED